MWIPNTLCETPMLWRVPTALGAHGFTVWGLNGVGYKCFKYRDRMHARGGEQHVYVH